MEPENKLIIYRASAGTGKTYTLVKEYLKLLIKRPVNYQQILAITFTNAATLEMKTRILESLQNLSKGEEPDLANQIIEELSREDQQEFTGQELKNNASKALSNIINDYSRFEISTIDAFFNRLVKSMARELKIPIEYNIELETDPGVKHSIRQLYEMDEPDSKLVWDWLEEFAFSRIEDDKGWKIDQEILKIGKKIFEEKFVSISADQDRNEKLIELRNDLRQTIHSFESNLIQWAKEAQQLIREHGVTMTMFKGKTKTSAFRKYEKLVEGDFSAKTLSSLLKVYTGEDHWYTDAIHKAKFDALDTAGLNDLNSKICEWYTSRISEYNTASLIERNIYAYALLNSIRENLVKFRDDNNLMFLADNASIIHGLLKTDDASFLYEKTGSYYKHIFIDEFQDTSHFQWENLLPLIENALSDFSESHRVFVVGDVKQSIYRWRGGDMQLLLEGVEKDLALYKNNTEVKDLQKNYRSKRNIIEFNNKFFQYSSQKILDHFVDDPDVYRIEKVYGDLNQVPTTTEEGLVTLNFFQEGNPSWKEQAKQHLLIQLKEVLESGYDLSDILILTTRNSEANDIANHLISNNYEVISQSSLLLNNVPVIQFILSILGFLFRNDDQIAKISLVYWYQKISGKPFDLDTGKIKEDRKYFLEAFPDAFSQRIKFLSRMPVYELVEELIVIFQLDRFASIFLQTFKEKTLAHTSSGLVGIRDFLEWWHEEDRELSVTSTVDLNAIRVMTIHKSKGLEAPVVFVPYCFYGMNSTKETIFWTDMLDEKLQKFELLPVTFKEEARNSVFKEAYNLENIEQYLDALNKTYVAFTRARDQLHIYSRMYSKHDENSISNISRFLYSWGIGQEGWIEADNQYRNGAYKQKPASGKPTKDLSIQHHQVLGRSYMEKVTIRAHSQNYYLLRDSRISENITIGIKRHEALSRLENKESIPAVLESMIREGALTVQEKQGLENELLALFENTLFASWFNPEWEVMAERAVFSQGKIYQPDRVVFNENETLIIDYKKEAEEAKHEKQVNHYGEILASMGYNNIKKYLIYVDNLKIKEVMK